MTHRNEPAVVVRDVHKAFGRTTVLAGVSLEIPRGTIYALLGPNGAGKTTLVHILSTLVPADRGTVTVAGADVATQRHLVRERISLTGQFATVDEVLTGRENLRLIAALLGVPRRDRSDLVAQTLTRFDLAGSADRPARTYSGGVRRRLDLAISLLRTPEVLILDEPTTGLDTRSRQQVWRLVRELTGHGVTVLLTSQYLDEADALADRIGVLHRGRIVAEGTPAELKARVGDERVALVDAAGTIVAERVTDGTPAGVSRALSELDGLAAERADLHVEIRRPTLDDVFLALTGDPVSNPTEDISSTDLVRRAA
jgi:ABC-2 type transport system ATP-binding protein